MQYACTYAEKNVMEYVFEEDCNTKLNCVIARKLNLEAKSLKDLLEKIRDEFIIELDYVLYNDDGCITFSRTENNDGEPPEKDEVEEWKLSQTKLWVADYTFWIEKRECYNITFDELSEAVRVER